MSEKNEARLYVDYGSQSNIYGKHDPDGPGRQSGATIRCSDQVEQGLKQINGKSFYGRPRPAQVSSAKSVLVHVLKFKKIKVKKILFYFMNEFNKHLHKNNS